MPRRADARVVRFAQPLRDERHQRFGLARAQRQREHVADVRGIEPRIGIGERIGVHVAGARQHPAQRAEHVRGGTVPGRSAHRIVHSPHVLHHRHEAVALIDPAIAARRRGDRSESALVVRADRAAPCDLDGTVLDRRVDEAVEVAEVVGISRRVDRARHDDAADERGPDRVEARRPVRRQTESGQVAVPDEQRAAAPHLQFEVAEAVERHRAAARGDAAAVLAPRRSVLNVPELPVARGHVGDRGRPGRRDEEKHEDEHCQ